MLDFRRAGFLMGTRIFWPSGRQRVDERQVDAHTDGSNSDDGCAIDMYQEGSDFQVAVIGGECWPLPVAVDTASVWHFPH